MATPTEVAWAAGFFEGEGYFTAATQQLKDGSRLYPHVGINNTDLAMLQRFQEIVGVGSIRPRRVANDRHRPQWRWATFNREHSELVRDLLAPWLSERRLAQAAAVFDTRGNLNQRKVFCPRGHRYTPENTYQWKKYRWCRSCLAARKAAA